MGAYVVSPHETIQEELHSRYVDVVGKPPACIGTQTGDPEPEVAGANRDARYPSDSDRGVVGQHQEVMEHRAGPELESNPPHLTDYGIERSGRPAGLLPEELSP
jgi:hypothetical protein